jgi:tripartite ATP-independent transporter DctM subunit
MMRAGYDPKLAAGTICAAGTLGQIIPPSTVLIFVGDILQGANQQAQLELGNLAPEPISVGQLFAGAMLPGLVLVGLYLAWILAKSIFDPQSCPPLKMSEEQRAGLPGRVLGALAPPLLLILAVLGSILAGIATPTESASVGAVGAMLLAGVKLRFDRRILHEVMRTTLSITSMVFVILLGASVFSLVFRGLGGENLVHDALASMPGGVFTAVLAVMLVIFVLGFFLDTFEIIFIVVPIAAPALIKLGVDPVWLGVMIGVNLQTSFLTPPFGFALFYLRGVAGKLLRTAEIYRGVVPFVVLQVIGLAVVWAAPGLATRLPEQLFAATAPLYEDRAPATSPSAPAGSPVADDFSDLLEEPAQRGQIPYLDDFENLLPDDSHK